MYIVARAEIRLHQARLLAYLINQCRVKPTFSKKKNILYNQNNPSDNTMLKLKTSR